MVQPCSILGFRRPQQQRDVLAGDGLQPRGNPSVDVAAPFVRELGLHGSSHDVVDDSDRGSLLHDQSRCDQLHPRCGEPILGPASDGDEILDRRLSSEHRDRVHEHCGVGPRRRETVGDYARDIRVDVLGPGEELAPEGRAAGPVGDGRCSPRIQRRVRGARERQCRVLVERSERHACQAIAEQSLQRCDERAHGGGPPTANDERQRITIGPGPAHQVVDECRGSLVRPLEVVDRDEERVVDTGRAMGRLEHGRPIGPRAARLRREHRVQDLLSCARGARERACQVVAERERQAHLRLVRRDRKPISPEVPRGLVDQPALADSGLAVHDHSGRPPLAERPSQSGGNHFELVRAPEEPDHARHTTRTSFSAGSEGVPS